MAMGTDPHGDLPASVRFTTAAWFRVQHWSFPDGRFRNDAQQRRVLFGRSVPGNTRAFDAAACRFLGTLNGALSIIPTGESGQPMHEHYSDQTPLWLSGEYHSMPIDSARVTEAAKHTLSLLPAN